MEQDNKLVKEDLGNSSDLKMVKANNKVSSEASQVLDVVDGDRQLHSTEIQRDSNVSTVGVIICLH